MPRSVQIVRFLANPAARRAVKRDRKAPDGAFLLDVNGWVGLASPGAAGIPQLERIAAKGSEEIPARGSDVERWTVGETETPVH